MAALGLGLGLGLSRARGGASDPYINPDIPAADNIVRCWSLRRNIPAYQNGIAIKADRTDPIGGDGETFSFLNNGMITIPAGDDAFAYELHDQKGASAAKLLTDTFAKCPKVFASSALLKGLFCDGGDLLKMGASDSAIETAIAAGKYTFSVWMNTSDSSLGRHSALYWGGGVSYGLHIFSIVAGKIEVFLRSSSRQTSSGTYSNGNWYHVVATIDVVANQFVVYIFSQAGALLETLTASSGAPSSIRSLFSIGSRDDGTFPYTGYVNDVCLWGVTLSSAQAAAVNAATRGYYPATGA